LCCCVASLLDWSRREMVKPLPLGRLAGARNMIQLIGQQNPSAVNQSSSQWVSLLYSEDPEDALHSVVQSVVDEMATSGARRRVHCRPDCLPACSVIFRTTCPDGSSACRPAVACESSEPVGVHGRYVSRKATWSEVEVEVLVRDDGVGRPRSIQGLLALVNLGE
jgi:hypothetical protein